MLEEYGDILPIRGNKKVAFIGKFAETPRYQGGGSSHINVSDELSALEAVRSVCKVSYAPAFSLKEDTVDETAQEEAVQIAAQSDLAVLFLGLPEYAESEGFDRANMRLPQNQLTLVERVLQVQKQVVVVLHNGAPVELPFADEVPAILEAYLGGQAGGGATVDLLFGAVSPCSKLAETFPLRLEDTPCYLNFPGHGDQVDYAEGVYVGYRYYDKRKLPVRFPFGHGLTYTTFAYSNLRVSGDTFRGEPLTVEVDVTNTGKVAAKEIVQFYVRPDHAGMDRPVRELKGFDQVFLAPGENGDGPLHAGQPCLQLLGGYDPRFGTPSRGCIRWRLRPAAGILRLSVPVTVENKPLPVHVTFDTTFGDVMTIPGGRELLKPLMEQHDALGGADEQMGEAGQAMKEAMLRFMPMHSVLSFSGGKITPEMLDELVKQLNELQK